MEIKKILNSREEKNIPLKGEIVLVVDGFKNSKDFDINKIREKLTERLKIMSLKDAVEEISLKEGSIKKLVYTEAIKIKDKI